MSARFYKIFMTVLAAHAVILTIVWVGFSAPLPKAPATFVYGGTLSPDDGAAARTVPWQESRNYDELIVDHLSQTDSNRWVPLRTSTKPFDYAHMGF